MRAVLALSLLLIAAPSAAGAAGDAGRRESLGVFAGWAAFRAPVEGRCEALSAASGSRGSPARAFVSVTSWPARGVRSQIFLQLSQPRQPRTPVWLDVGAQRFRLSGSGPRVWALDPAGDAAIIAAMRRADSMEVSGTATNGRAIHDRYGLRGAASAIDAAALGCLAR